MTNIEYRQWNLPAFASNNCSVVIDLCIVLYPRRSLKYTTLPVASTCKTTGEEAWTTAHSGPKHDFSRTKVISAMLYLKNKIKWQYVFWVAESIFGNPFF